MLKLNSTTSKFVKKNQNIKIGSIFYTIAMCTLLNAYKAQAQVSIIPPPLQDPVNAPHHVPSYCNQSALSGIEFMKALSKIVAHGELTDISFIEKTFDTKLRPQSDVNPDMQRLIYQTDDLLGSPIQINLFIHVSNLLRYKSGWIAYMNIAKLNSQSPLDTGPNFISDCLHITAPELSSFFGGGGWIGAPTDGVSFAEYRDVGLRKGQKGSTISLNFQFNRNDQIVTKMTIIQAEKR